MIECRGKGRRPPTGGGGEAASPVPGVPRGVPGGGDAGRVWVKSEGGAANAQWRVHSRRWVMIVAGAAGTGTAPAIYWIMESTRTMPRSAPAGFGVAEGALAAARARYTGFG